MKRKTRFAASKPKSTVMSRYRQKTSPYRKLGRKALPRKRVRAVSVSRSSQLRDYARLKKLFFEYHGKGCYMRHDGTCQGEIDIHHSQGRRGKLLCETSKWFQLCRRHHDWVHKYPTLARTAGLLCEKGKWNCER